MPAADVAEALAKAKAIEVSSRNSGAWVIGSDQVLAQGEIIFSKAATRDEARSTLQALRGKTHSLHSAAALVQHGIVVWQHVQTANLTMRMFSDAWLEQYLDAAGDALVQSVGAYQVEGLGIQLFESIDGDYFTILGMPLLALLSELRRREVMAS